VCEQRSYRIHRTGKVQHRHQNTLDGCVGVCGSFETTAPNVLCRAHASDNEGTARDETANAINGSLDKVVAYRKEQRDYGGGIFRYELLQYLFVGRLVYSDRAQLPAENVKPLGPVKDKQIVKEQQTGEIQEHICQ
jgi:hypothetical protein